MTSGHISPAEMQVMRVLWAHPQSTSAYLIEQLGPAFDWQAVTIKTLLGRLKKKGLVRAEKVEGKYRYEARIDEDQELTRYLGRLLDNLCNTRHVDLAKQLLVLGDFSKDDLRLLGQMIQEKELDAKAEVVCRCLPSQCTCGQQCRRGY